MINWWVYWSIWVGIGFRVLFNSEYLIWLNLLLIILSRAFYLGCFYFNYIKYPAISVDSQKVQKPTRKFWIQMAIKNIALIAVCIFSIVFAAVFSIYSVLVGTGYIRQIANRLNPEKKRQRLGILVGTYVLNSLLIAFSVYGIIAFDPEFAFALPIDIGISLGMVEVCAAVIIGIFLSAIPGRKFTKAPFSRYTRQVLGKLSGKVRVVVLVLMVVLPSVFFINAFIFSIPNKEFHWVEMTDGTKLATEVYFSPLIGRKAAPVVLVRCPYGMRESIPEWDTSLYNSLGYHVVLQDIRGTFESEGKDTTIMFINDASDGNETINWILKHSWCNGKIAGAGISAMAIAQYLCGGLGPKGLCVQSLKLGTPDVIADAIFDGAIRQSLINDWAQLTTPGSWMKQLDYLYAVVNNQSLQDDETVRRVELLNPPNTFAQVNCRALHVGGWYDIFLGGSLRGYKGYNTLGTENARGHQKLIIGPWGHGMWAFQMQGELTYPRNSIGTDLINQWEAEIFDDSLLGQVTEGMWDKRVAYYLMGDVDDKNVNANKWKYADSWPLLYVQNPWYLGVVDGKLSVVDDETTLDGFANLSYLYDPSNPMVTHGGSNLFSNPMGPADQRVVEENDNGEVRSDILRFESDTLTSPYTIEGDLTVKLVIKSDCTDTDFMVKLCDVYPDGRHMLIRDGALTARCRDVNFTSLNYAERKITEHLLTPGVEYTLYINLIAAAYQFNTGHKIAITVSSSNYPRYKLNANTGGSLCDDFTVGKIANNTIITGPGKSCILMPELH